MNTLGMVRNTDPITSHLAAQRMVKKKVSIREKVHELFRIEKSMTDYRLERLYCDVYEQRPYSSIHKRRKDLVDLGFVRDSGRTEVIPTGSTVIVWELVTNQERIAA